jgi:hypothetical protein
MSFNRDMVISIFALIAPWFIGGILNEIEFQPLGFLLLAIYPQLIIFPYSGYLQGYEILILVASFTHWILLFSCMSFFFYARRIDINLTKMLVFCICSVVIVHLCFNIFGFDFFIDSI